MFGYTQRSSMIGQDLFSHYEPGDDERARQRTAKMETLPVGALLPMAEFKLRTLSRRRRLVQATSVRVDATSGPATLSFFIDQTETSRAQEALRRSEGLLSHLVATSPDVITLTEMSSGRYAMVNKTFERLSGYTSDEVMGRTADELGIWQNLADRDQVVSAVRQHGRINEMPFNFVAKSGEVISMVLSAAPFNMDGQAYLVINARDVSETERTRLVHAAILQNASIGICLTRDQHFVQVNPLVEEMFGWPPGTLLGQHASVVWPNPEAYASVAADLGPRFEAGEQVETERSMRRHDGTFFLCRILAKASTPTTPAAAARSGFWKTSPRSAASKPPWRRPRTRRKPPTAPRAPSWPTPATRSAPRSTACWAWRACCSSPICKKRPGANTWTRCWTAPRACPG